MVIEAWAHHKPVIAADAVGPAALIEHERTGMMFPVDDVASLANAIRTLVLDPAQAQEIGQAGYEEYRRRFTETAVVERYMTLCHRP